MKKIILPLLLILTVGMLAAVESEPSEVVGFVKYDIAEGNSMIAIPMTTTYTMAGDLGTAIGATTVSYWDNNSQAFVAAEYIDWLGDWDNNFPIASGSVLMVNAPSATTFYSIGDLPETNPTFNLVVGNNMIMIPLNRSDLNMAGLVGNITNSQTVSYWNNTAQAFVASEYIDWMDDWDNNFPTSIGDPLMVNANSVGVFPSISKKSTNFLNSRKDTGK